MDSYYIPLSDENARVLFWITASVAKEEFAEDLPEFVAFLEDLDEQKSKVKFDFDNHMPMNDFDAPRNALEMIFDSDRSLTTVATASFQSLACMFALWDLNIKDEKWMHSNCYAQQRRGLADKFTPVAKKTAKLGVVLQSPHSDHSNPSASLQGDRPNAIIEKSLEKFVISNPSLPTKDTYTIHKCPECEGDGVLAPKDAVLFCDECSSRFKKETLPPVPRPILKSTPKEPTPTKKEPTPTKKTSTPAKKAPAKKAKPTQEDEDPSIANHTRSKTSKLVPQELPALTTSTTDSEAEAMWPESDQSDEEPMTIDGQTHDNILALISRVFDTKTKQLCLSKIEEQEELDEVDADLSSKLFCHSLFESVASMCPEVASIDLSDNFIKCLLPIGLALQEHLPGVKSINLSRNLIDDPLELVHLSPLPLNEIALAGCPFSVSKMPKSLTKFLVERFPHLKTVDGVPVHDPVVLPPFQDYYAANSEMAEFAHRFIREFMEMLDGDRSNLRYFYNPNSVFSYSLNLANRQCAGQEKEMATLKEKMPYNRNHLIAHENPECLNYLACGENIVGLYTTAFPKTRHAPDFTFDVFVLPAGGKALFVTVQGTYTEGDGHIRRYSHTFMLMENPSNTKFGLSPVSIINEQLTVGLPRLPEEQFKSPQRQQLIQKLCTLTGLDKGSALSCLVWHSWDVEKSAAATRALQAAGQVPSHFFSKN